MHFLIKGYSTVLCSNGCMLEWWRKKKQQSWKKKNKVCYSSRTLVSWEFVFDNKFDQDWHNTKFITTNYFPNYRGVVLLKIVKVLFTIFRCCMIPNRINALLFTTQGVPVQKQTAFWQTVNRQNNLIYKKFIQKQMISIRPWFTRF